MKKQDKNFYNLTNQQQDKKFEEIMSETFGNIHYMDEQLENIIPIKKLASISSQHLQKSDDPTAIQQQIIHNNYDEEIGLYQQKESYNDVDHQFQKSEIQSDEIKNKSILEQIEGQQIKDFQPLEYAEVQKKYNFHLLKQQQKLKLQQNYSRHIPNHINTIIKNQKKNVTAIQIYLQNQERTIILATDVGEILIFYPNSQKYIALKPFNSEINVMRISKNLEYLAVASTDYELIIYKLRQPIVIQNTHTYRIIPKPTIFHQLNPKQFKCPIVQIQFLSNCQVLEMIVLDEGDQIYHITVKKKFLHYKSYIQKFPIIFSHVFMFKIYQKNQENKKFIILAVSSQEAITLLLIKPKFQIIFVYQQSNRQSIIKQGRIGHIDFYQEKLLILWDKYLEIINIELIQTDPVEYNIHTLHHYFFAENSLTVGFLSETLVYQFSRFGLKVYSINQFPTGSRQKRKNQCQIQSTQLYTQQLPLEGFPKVNNQNLQQLKNNQPPIPQLRNIIKVICCTLNNKSSYNYSHNNYLAYVYNNRIESIQFVPYKQYVIRKIDSEGNWKLGLTVLKGIYEGKVFELDCINIIPNEVNKKDKNFLEFQKISQQYVERYLEIFFNLIKKQKVTENWNEKDIENQQILFLCDFLIRTANTEFMMNDVIKLSLKLEIDFLFSLEAYILLKKIHYLGTENIQFFFERYPKSILSKLIYSLDIQNNELHIIKSQLIKKQMYLQFLYLSTCQEDFYTPFVILMTTYKQQKKKENSRLLKIIIEYLLYYLKKSIKGQKIPIGQYQIRIHKIILKQILLKILIPENYEDLLQKSGVLIFRQVLPAFFCEKTLSPLNSLEHDPEILAYFRQNRLETDIIESIIIKNIPLDVVQRYSLEEYWKFILQLFSRSLIIYHPIITGFHYAIQNKIINNEFVLKLIDKKQFRKQLEQYKALEDLKEVSIGTQYVQLRILLHIITKNYVQSTKILLSSSSTNKSIYNHLHTILPLISPDSETLRQLSLLLKNQIKFLAEVDIRNLQSILKNYFSSEQKIFIQVLKPYPELQLSLIQQIIKTGEEQEHQLRVQYLQLLGQLNHFQKVEKQIFTNLYPLDQSLQICRKYKIYKGEAYLYERLGDVEKAIQKHFVVLHNNIQEEEFDSLDEKDYINKINELLEPIIFNCIKICKNISQRGQYEYQRHWFVIIQELQTLKRNCKRYYIPVRNHINFKIYPIMFKQIMANVQLESILQYLQNNMNRLEFYTIRQSFSLLIKGYSYEKEMLYKCKNMMVQNADITRDQLLDQYKKGFLSICKCDICNGCQDLVVRYPCKHQIHPYCTNDIKICLICVLQDPSFEIKQSVMKQQIKFELITSEKKMEQQPFSPKKKVVNKRNRMIEYDFISEQISEEMKKYMEQAL